MHISVEKSVISIERDNAHGKATHQAAEGEVRNDETKEVPYMTFAMKMWEERTEGRMEGIITSLKDFGASGNHLRFDETVRTDKGSRH